MQQHAEFPAGSYGRPGECEPAEVGGRLIFLIPRHTVPAGDETALAEGFCPDCHARLAGPTGTWCPQCFTTWHVRRGSAPGSQAAAGTS